MSQRLRSTDGRPTPAFIFDPRFPWMGSEGEGTGAPDGGGTGSGDGGGGSADPNGDGSGAGQGGGTQDPPGGQQPDTVSRADYDTLQARMQAADRATAAANAKVKEYEDKDKTTAQRLQDEATAAKAEADQLRAELKDQRVANAFFASAKHTWHNPARALQVLDRSTVTVKEDGTVDGLDAAIEALAKSDPYLVKPAGDPPPPSGDGQDGKKPPGGGDKVDRDKLLNKYPALRR